MIIIGYLIKDGKIQLYLKESFPNNLLFYIFL